MKREIKISVKRKRNEETKTSLISFCQKTKGVEITLHLLRDDGTEYNKHNLDNYEITTMLSAELAENRDANEALNELIQDLQNNKIEYSVKTTATERILTVAI